MTSVVCVCVCLCGSLVHFVVLGKMAATDSSSSNALIIEELRVENERLSRELDQASSEKIQSAQFGLGLLEEKGQLQTKCEELENLYENTRHELDITQEVCVFRTAT